MRRGWLGLAIAATLVLAPTALAQPSASGPDTLALTSQSPSSASAPQTQACPTLNLYQLVPSDEGPEQSSKAYLTRTSAVIACRTQFYVDPPGAFNLTGSTTADLFVGCEQRSAFLAGFPDISLELNRNGQAITTGSADLGNTCSPGSPIEAEITMDPPEDPAFAAEDTLRLNVSVFGSPGWMSENFHLLVGGNETASTLTLPGLSEAYASEEPDDASSQTANETNATNTSLTRTSTDAGEEQNGTPGFTIAAAFLAGLAASLVPRRR